MDQNTIFEDSILSSKWFNPDYLFNQGVSFFHKISNLNIQTGPEVFAFFHAILFIFALFFLTIISYCVIRMIEIRSKEDAHLKHEIAEYAHHQALKKKKLEEGSNVSKNERWIKTLGYLFSQHSSDWKLSIIEADAMLDDLMTQLGFKGETLGEKLKSATQDNFHNLTVAWEVHTIRNKIAHEGALFEISQYEAKRVIALYEPIFREFGYI